MYCLSRREVEALAEWLEGEGHSARPYHAGLADETRRRHQEEFLQERVDVMVATVAFGMGIDRSNIRFVVHAGAPRSLEHYQQESGRAGRDGLEAECILFCSGADFARWRQMLEQSGEFTDTARRLLTGMSRYAAGTRCRHRTLVEYFDQPYGRDACGACDWCLKELERVDDALELSQKILSGVARLGQRWGVGHVIDVLRGRATDAVGRARHQALSTFGLLADVPVAELRGYLDQLTEQELLLRTAGPFPVLQLTERGVAALKGRAEVELYRQPAAGPRPAQAASRRRPRDLGRRRPRAVRRPAAVPPRGRAGARRPALRRLPRQHAARPRPAAADHPGRAAAGLRHRRPEGRGPRAHRARGDPGTRRRAFGHRLSRGAEAGAPARATPVRPPAAAVPETRRSRRDRPRHPRKWALQINASAT